MTFNEITSLLDKGFTPEQITVLATSTETETPGQLNMFTNSGESTAPDSEDTGDADNPLSVSPVPPTSPAPAAEPAAAPGEVTNDSLSAVMDAIADVKKTIQAANIRTMSMETVNADNALEKAMSEIIRPSFEKGE